MSAGLVYLSEFRLLNGFYRCLGYSFIDNDFNNGEAKLTSRRLSPYAAYVALTWTVIIGTFAYDAAEFVNVFDESQVLDKATSLLYSFRTIAVQACSLVLIVTQARSIVHVSTYLTDLEVKLKFSIPFRGTSRKLIVINLIFSAVAVVSVLPLLYFFEQELSRRQIIWNTFYLAVCVIHGQSSCLVTYTWAMFFTEAFAAYVASINAELTHILDTTYFNGVNKTFRELHGLFVRVTEAFELCEEMLGKFMAVVFSLNLIVAAPWSYWIIKELDQPLISLLSALGFAGLCAQMAIVSIYPIRPYKQAKKTWDVLTKLLVSQEHTPEVREQIQEFRHTCQNQDFSFSGCGFFKVGPPLIVSIASAIITYTVILYQSDNSSSNANPAPVNATHA